MINENSDFFLVYDGGCPMCSMYVELLNIRRDFGDLRLINAREDSVVVDQLKRRGINLNTGLVLKVEAELYQGEEAMNKLALLSTKITSFNRLNYWIFKSNKRSKYLYPLLKLGRGILLQILRRSKI